jgi:N-methylhydantoinase A
MRLIGVDTGGTFTDAVVIGADGGMCVGKALTTHGQLIEGVLESIGRAAASIGLSRATLLAGTEILSHGTTVGLNALLTGTGARVGLLVTAGFESTLPMARSNKLHGLGEEDITDARRWCKPPLMVPRRHIHGVVERVDCAGTVIVPLDEDQARKAIRKLLAAGAESIAIALMWSPVNDRHERRLAQLVAEEAPEVPVSLSSTIAPRIGEYERTATAVMNAYIAPLVSRYLDSLERRVRAEGFSGRLLIMTMGGGVRQAATLRDAPVHLLQSGPVGGLMASQRLGAGLGCTHVIATDVGGTSFDVGLVVDGRLPRAARPRIARHGVAVPVIDIASVGTGGGSIAWFDQRLSALQVGPQSAGSMPGPACYGRGGMRPTVTDAAVVLGYLDRLGGSLQLDKDAARQSMRDIAARLGLSVEAAAEGVLRVANAQMADLVRRSTIQRGHDPRLFTLLAYGGAAPQYVGRYAAEIGVRRVVIPSLAPQFSAWGSVCADFRTLLERELPPRPFRLPLDAFETALDRLERGARAELGGLDGPPAVASDTGIVISRFAGLRFTAQIHSIDVALPAGPLTGTDIEAAEAEFRRGYERLIGRGSNAADSTVEIITVSVEARAKTIVPPPHAGMATPVPQPVRFRGAWFDGTQCRVPVYAWSDLGAGAGISGPAFVESEETTAVIYPGQRTMSDAFGNLEIKMHENAAR